MRKTIITIFLVACALSQVSCSGDAQNYLSIETPMDRVYIIPATVYSCKAQFEGGADEPDITGPSFSIRDLKLKWSHEENTLTVLNVRVSFDNSNLGGKYSCNIVNDELRWLGPVALATTPVTYSKWSQRILPGSSDTPTEKLMGCEVICGGVTAKEGKSFVASGKLEVIGYMTTPEGDDIPVRNSIPFSIENLQ